MLHLTGGQWRRVATVDHRDAETVVPDGQGGILVSLLQVQRTIEQTLTVVRFSAGGVRSRPPLPAPWQGYAVNSGIAMSGADGIVIAGAQLAAGRQPVASVVLWYRPVGS